LRLVLRDGAWELCDAERVLAQGDIARTDDIDALLSEVTAIDATDAARNGTLDVTISDRWVQTFEVAPPSGVRDLSELRQLVELRRRTLFGSDETPRVVSADWQAAGGFIAAALPEVVVQSLQALCARHGWRLRSVRPVWAAASEPASKWCAIGDGHVITLVHRGTRRARWVRTQALAHVGTRDDAQRLAERNALAVPNLPAAAELSWVDASNLAISEGGDDTFDFARSTSPWRRPAPVPMAAMAAIAVVAATAMVLGAARYSALRGEQRLLSAALDATSTAPTLARPSKSPGPTADQVGAAQQLVARLDAPWMPWLRALEASSHPDTALMAVEVDGALQRVRGTALARTPQAMLDYVDRLQEQSVLGTPRLLRHDTVEKTPGQPLRFEFTSEQGSGAAAGPVRSPP
jgi:hypothetical protein